MLKQILAVMPFILMFIGTAYASEYFVGENATLWIQLLDNDTIVEDAKCSINVWYPNKTLWIDQSMDYLDGGIYYIDLVVPNQTGVYLASVKCSWKKAQTTYKKWFAEEMNVHDPSIMANYVNVSINPMDVWKTFFKLGTPPLMPSTVYYCKDNSTLVKDITFTYCENNVCTNYTKTEEIPCTYGCDMQRNECIPSPTTRYLTILAIILFLILIPIIIWRYI